MTQDKMRRIVTACVAAATVLFVFLLGFLIYQWVTIGTENKRIDAVNKDIAKLEQQIEDAEDRLQEENLKLELEWLAFEAGWVKK